MEEQKIDIKKGDVVVATNRHTFESTVGIVTTVLPAIGVAYLYTGIEMIMAFKINEDHTIQKATFIEKLRWKYSAIKQIVNI